jgi:uncharacterized DUF497 family protein
MDYELSQHARTVISERKIPLAWVERVIDDPQRVEPDLQDPELEHRLKAVPEYDGRVLRVIINTETTPVRIVSVYFDRSMRDKL